ncbi:GNAT family N-acetyltransferase [Conexibacter sp. SYSU D00693]|uniref:GNAT family N-acetyltransferase n=1 Tax=Conexibacter sp. SYSU D00693 TaxID=2812560 RepID=UPI00196B9EF8|nr:GNAT family N-acetyltransferase [Conexibacter sp. SYSU D00693]
MRVVLPTGLQLRVRPIRSADKLLIADGLARLSPESQHRRFLGPKPRLSAKELRYLTEVDHVDHVALVAVREDRPDVVVGVGRWVRDRERPDQAEIAVVIADDLHGLGLGSRLGEALARAAAARGVRRFTATMLADNTAAHRLMARIDEALARELATADLPRVAPAFSPPVAA